MLYLALIIAAATLILVAAARKPDTITVQRSALIHADPAAVFALLNNFHYWPRWAPQDRDDPALVRTFEGAAEGVGAISHWKGSGASGEGRMEITRSELDSLLEVQVAFMRPFRALNTNRFALERRAGGTLVTWSMTGSNVFLLKVMSVFASSDRMLGRHFEAGLANLQAALG